MRYVLLAALAALFMSSPALADEGTANNKRFLDVARGASFLDAVQDTTHPPRRQSRGGGEMRDGLGSLVVGVHLGLSIPTAHASGVMAMPRVEIGYNIPALGERLEPFLSATYIGYPVEDTVADTRVPGGSFDYSVWQHQTQIGIGMYGRFFELGEFINPYIGAAFVIFMLQTEASGEAGGSAFGEHTAQATEYGFYTAAGLDVVLGPGAAFFEIGFTYSDLDNKIMGDSDTGTVAPTFGYRFMFL